MLVSLETVFIGRSSTLDSTKRDGTLVLRSFSTKLLIWSGVPSVHQTLLPDAGRRVRHRTAAADGLPAHFLQNAARTVFHLAATPLARRIRRLGWFSDDLQPVLLPEKPALVYPARVAAHHMDVKPSPHPRKKLERIVYFMVPHRPQHSCRQPATPARQRRQIGRASCRERV